MTTFFTVSPSGDLSVSLGGQCAHRTWREVSQLFIARSKPFLFLWPSKIPAALKCLPLSNTACSFLQSSSHLLITHPILKILAYFSNFISTTYLIILTASTFMWMIHSASLSLSFFFNTFHNSNHLFFHSSLVTRSHGHTPGFTIILSFTTSETLISNIILFCFLLPIFSALT